MYCHHFNFFDIILNINPSQNLVVVNYSLPVHPDVANVQKTTAASSNNTSTPHARAKTTARIAVRFVMTLHHAKLTLYQGNATGSSHIPSRNLAINLGLTGEMEIVRAIFRSDLQKNYISHRIVRRLRLKCHIGPLSKTVLSAWR